MAGTTIDSYVIEEEIGSGGLGVVYRVKDTTTGAHYALKTLLSVADPELV